VPRTVPSQQNTYSFVNLLNNCFKYFFLQERAKIYCCAVSKLYSPNNGKNTHKFQINNLNITVLKYIDIPPEFAGFTVEWFTKNVTINP